MTDSSDWEHAAEEIARLNAETEALRKQFMPAVRSAQEYLDRMRANQADVESLARELREAMDLGTAELGMIVRRFGGFGEATASTGQAGADPAAEGTITGSGGVELAKLRIVALGDTGAAADSISVVRLEDVGNLTAKVRRDGISGLSYNQIFLLTLVLVMSVGLVTIVPDLSPKAQAELGTDLGIIGIALAVVAMVTSDRNR